MEDASIDVANVISDAVRAVGVMTGELVCFFFTFFCCFLFFLFKFFYFFGFFLVAFWFMICFRMIIVLLLVSV